MHQEIVIKTLTTPILNNDETMNDGSERGSNHIGISSSSSGYLKVSHNSVLNCLFLLTKENRLVIYDCNSFNVLKEIDWDLKTSECLFFVSSSSSIENNFELEALKRYDDIILLGSKIRVKFFLKLIRQLLKYIFKIIRLKLQCFFDFSLPPHYRLLQKGRYQRYTTMHRVKYI